CFEVAGHDPGTTRRQTGSLLLHLELVLERLRLDEDGLVDHIPMQLESFALPRGRVVHDFIDVNVVFGALGQRGVEQPANGKREYCRGDRDLDRFRFHSGLREVAPSEYFAPERRSIRSIYYTELCQKPMH